MFFGFSAYSNAFLRLLFLLKSCSYRSLHMQLVMVMVALAMMDRFGRRDLLLIGTLGEWMGGGEIEF